MSNLTRKIVSSILLFCFIITDFSSALAKESAIALDPAIFNDVAPESYTKNPSQLSEQEIKQAKSFLQKPTQYTLEIMFLLKNLYHRVQMEEEAQGTEAIAKILSKRKDSENIEFEVENLGKAEPLVINTERGPLFFTKVRHNDLKMTMLFIDKNQIDLPLLEETERLEKAGKLSEDKTLHGLSKKEIALELKHRKFILKHMRTLYARMLMSEWNPQLEYTPLSEIVEKANTESNPLSSAPEEVQHRVHDVLNSPIIDLEQKPWFMNLATRTYDTWVDLAKQEQNALQKNPGNEELMIVLYDGKTGEVNPQTLQKASKYSFEYWKMYWKAIWEKPAYDENLWKTERGLGKMRVLLTGDYLMGISFGLMLGSLSFMVSSALPNSLPHGLNAFDVAKISFGWSLFFGVFSKTWQNFVYRGNDFVRFLKNWSTGLGQSLHFNLISDESLKILDANGDFDPNALKIYGDILINQSVKTVTKTSLQEVPRFRAKTGEAEGTYKIKDYKIVLPWKHNMKFMEFEVVESSIDPLKLARWVRDQFSLHEREPREWEKKTVLRFHKDIKITVPWLIPMERETSIPRKNVEGQLPQLVTTPIGLLSRFGYTVWGVPLGHILYALLGPMGEIRQIRYKARYADEIARKYGEDHALTRRMRKMVQTEIDNWNNLKILRVPATQFIGYYVKVVPVQVWNTAKELATWASLKASYSTYLIYDGIRNDLSRINETTELQTAAQGRHKLMMTVQTDGGKPTEKQVFDALYRDKPLLCSRLFQ